METERGTGLGCSAQARSYRDKSPSPAGMSGLVHRLPPLTAYTLTGWAFHPVPVALREVSYLAHVEETTGTRDLEFVSEPSRVAITARTSTDPAGDTGFAEHFTSSARVITPAVDTVTSECAKRPRWELLRPSVVIRRRPQRD